MPDPALGRSWGGTLTLAALVLTSLVLTGRILTGLVSHLVVQVLMFIDATLLDVAIVVLVIPLAQAFLIVRAVRCIRNGDITLDLGGNPVRETRSSRACVGLAGRLRIEQRRQRQQYDDSEKGAKHDDSSGN